MCDENFMDEEKLRVRIFGVRDWDVIRNTTKSTTEQLFFSF